MDNSTLFEKVDALDNPLLGGQGGDRADERRRMDRMNNKLVDANLMGYEAEMYGNNIRNELFRNDEQFIAVEFNNRAMNKKGVESRRLMKLIHRQIKKSNMVVNLAYYGMIGSFFLIIIIRLWKILS